MMDCTGEVQFVGEFQTEKLPTGPLIDLTMIEEPDHCLDLVGRPFHCTLCPYQAKTTGKLNDHIRSHTGERPFQCPETDCEFAATTSSILRRHLLVHKQQERSFACTVCDLKFGSKSILDQHLKTHGQTRPYACPVCHYRGKRKAHVIRHLATIHTNERAYKCQHCEFTTNLKGTMDAHTKKEHLSTQPQEKWCQCPHCEFKCNRAFDLKKHLRLHTTDQKPHPCQFCEYSAARKGQLRSHLRARHQRQVFVGHGHQGHEGVQDVDNDGGKYLKCDLCPFFTISNADLVAHSQNHTVDKVYECGQCPFICSTSGRLAIHQKTHAPNNNEDTKIWTDDLLTGGQQGGVNWGLSTNLVDGGVRFMDPAQGVVGPANFFDATNGHYGYHEIKLFNNNNPAHELNEVKFRNGDIDEVKYTNSALGLDDVDRFVNPTVGVDEVKFLNVATTTGHCVNGVAHGPQDLMKCPGGSRGGDQDGVDSEPCILCKCAKELHWEGDQFLKCLH